MRPRRALHEGDVVTLASCDGETTRRWSTRKTGARPCPPHVIKQLAGLKVVVIASTMNFSAGASQACAKLGVPTSYPRTAPALSAPWAARQRLCSGAPAGRACQALSVYQPLSRAERLSPSSPSGWAGLTFHFMITLLQLYVYAPLTPPPHAAHCQKGAAAAKGLPSRWPATTKYNILAGSLHELRPCLSRLSSALSNAPPARPFRAPARHGAGLGAGFSAGLHRGSV